MPKLPQTAVFGVGKNPTGTQIATILCNKKSNRFLGLSEQPQHNDQSLFSVPLLPKPLIQINALKIFCGSNLPVDNSLLVTVRCFATALYVDANV
jgi:hypothetical protein